MSLILCWKMDTKFFFILYSLVVAYNTDKKEKFQFDNLIWKIDI